MFIFHLIILLHLFYSIETSRINIFKKKISPNNFNSVQKKNRLKCFHLTFNLFGKWRGELKKVVSVFQSTFKHIYLVGVAAVTKLSSTEFHQQISSIFLSLSSSCSKCIHYFRMLSLIAASTTPTNKKFI